MEHFFFLCTKYRGINYTRLADSFFCKAISVLFPRTDTVHKSNVGFSVFLRNTLPSDQEELEIGPPTLQLMDNSLHHQISILPSAAFSHESNMAQPIGARPNHNSHHFVFKGLTRASPIVHSSAIAQPTLTSRG